MGHRSKDAGARHRHSSKRSRKQIRRVRKQRKQRRRRERGELSEVPFKGKLLEKCAGELAKCTGLPFQDILNGDLVYQLLEELGVEYRERTYSPLTTLWAFLSQVINKEESCETAVTRVIQDRILQGKRPCSTNTAPYCEARQRLSEELIYGLVNRTGMQLTREAFDTWLWKNRHVFLIDGSTIDMTDTEENQREYPQSSNQEEGLGFPIARIAVLFSLATGAVVDGQIGSIKGKKTGENELFRQMYDTFRPGDIVVGDCLYDSYRDIAELQSREVDLAFGMKQSRNSDFRKGEKLGPDDHIVIWKRPTFDATRIDRETWEKLPETLRMRELQVTVRIRGKLQKIRVVTTLLDPSEFSKEDILELFRQRWNVEVDIRCLKALLGMDHLACKSPSMVRKEFFIYLLAYNLIRIRMAQAAALHNKKPREISFTGARTAMAIWMPIIALAPTKEIRESFERLMLDMIASRTVGNRPGRSEPRKRKRRPNSKYGYLTQPRSKEQKGLAA